MMEDDMSSSAPKRLSDTEILNMIRKILDDNSGDPAEAAEGPEDSLAKEMTSPKKPGYI